MIHNVDPQLSQWDVGRIVSISNSEATHIHFANQGDSKAVIIKIENGSAKIPDYLLQTGKTIIAYAVKDGVTLESKSFSVRKREKPENYVYEDDQRNYIYELITDAESAVENANLATQNANEAADKALQAASSWVMVGEASGENVSFNDAVNQRFAGFRIFGKTTQDGTPTPDAPVDLVSVGDSGSITVNVNNTQSMTIATPNGLPGIPVTSGGNYTDADGQQWVCDEIDFAKGVYVQRVSEHITPTFFSNGNPGGNVYLYSIYLYETENIRNTKVLSTHFEWGLSGALAAMLVGQMIVREGTNYPVLYCATSITTDSEFNAWVQENNVRFLSILATPIETPLSEEELAAYADLHTYKDYTAVSNDAGAWMDIEYVMDAKKYIDSLVISGGSATPAKLASVTLPASKWVTEAENLHSQVVAISGTTKYSKVDLLPSVEQLAIFHNKDVAFMTENDNGVVTVYAIGDKPLLDYTMQAQITEVEV